MRHEKLEIIRRYRRYCMHLAANADDEALWQALHKTSANNQIAAIVRVCCKRALRSRGYQINLE